MGKLVIILLFAMLLGCDNSEVTNDKFTIKINFHEPIQSLLSKSTAPLPKDCNSDICFFEFDISSANPNKAVLTIESKSQPMVFDDVISAALMTYKSDTLSNSYITLNGVVCTKVLPGDVTVPLCSSASSRDFPTTPAAFAHGNNSTLNPTACRQGIYNNSTGHEHQSS